MTSTQTPNTYPPYVNSGRQVLRKLIRSGDKYEIKEYNGINTVMDILDGYQKILCSDGWIRRCYYDCEVMVDEVYLIT